MSTVSNTPARDPIQISPHLKLQPPLSRRGHGPGLILVLDHYAHSGASDKSLDPAPLKKWAEEGYAVAQILIPGSGKDGGEFPLQVAIDALKGMEECDSTDGEFGLILYLNHIPFYISQAVCLSPSIKAIISYGGKHMRSANPDEEPLTTPQLLHISGPEEPRRESFSVVPKPDLQEPSSSSPTSTNAKSFRYPTAPKDSPWILPADPSYHSPSAKLAHARSLAFLKPLLHGPYFDVEAIWEEHCKLEFEERDVAKTMATMIDMPYVNHIPTLTGGIGKERLTAFYAAHFIFANPADTRLELVSRTVGVDTVVDEFVYEATHDREVDWLLPAIPPTGKQLRIPVTSVVKLRGDRLCHEHISWDQATALRQLGLLPDWVPFPYPIDGRSPAEGKRFEVRLPVLGADTARKLVDESCVESNELIERNGGVGWREVDV